jgi:hypothetical protein
MNGPPEGGRYDDRATAVESGFSRTNPVYEPREPREGTHRDRTLCMNLVSR